MSPNKLPPQYSSPGIPREHYVQEIIRRRVLLGENTDDQVHDPTGMAEVDKFAALPPLCSCAVLRLLLLTQTLF